MGIVSHSFNIKGVGFCSLTSANSSGGFACRGGTWTTSRKSTAATANANPTLAAVASDTGCAVREYMAAADVQSDSVAGYAKRSGKGCVYDETEEFAAVGELHAAD